MRIIKGCWFIVEQQDLLACVCDLLACCHVVGVANLNHLSYVCMCASSRPWPAGHYYNIRTISSTTHMQSVRKSYACGGLSYGSLYALIFALNFNLSTSFRKTIPEHIVYNCSTVPYPLSQNIVCAGYIFFSKHKLCRF